MPRISKINKDSESMGTDNQGKEPWWVQATKTLGLPTVFLGVVVYMIWTAGIWAGNEIIMPIFKKQMAFIDEASAMTKEMTTTSSEINRTMKAQGEHAVEVLRLSGQIRESMMEVQKQAKANGDAIELKNGEMLRVLQNIEQNTKDLAPKATP